MVWLTKEHLGPAVFEAEPLEVTGARCVRWTRLARSGHTRAVKPPDYSSFVATYAAAVASVAALVGMASLAWNVYVGRRDKHEILLRVGVFEVLVDPHLARQSTSAVKLTISNRGRRPVTIAYAGWVDDKGKGAMFVPLKPLGPQDGYIVPATPYKLSESERVDFTWPLKAFEPKAPMSFHVYDAHNNEIRLGWRASRKARKQIQRALHRARADLTGVASSK